MAPKKLPLFLTEDEQDLLLARLQNLLDSGSREGMLSALLIRLMMNIGLRVSEVINFRMGDLDMGTDGRAWVREGKGKKDRAIQISPPDLSLLRRWLYEHRLVYEQPHPASWVFTTINGNRLDDRWVRRVVKRECLQAGIQKDVHPHTLRHTMATDYYGQTRDMVKLQMLLGHSDIRTTFVYVHLNPAAALQEATEIAVARLSRRSTM